MGWLVRETSDKIVGEGDDRFDIPKNKLDLLAESPDRPTIL